MRLLLLLLLLACSSGPEHRGDLARGVYAPPPPNPTFNPTTDAPHRTGQPGHVNTPPVLPRSPHTRVLPPTSEPGLWAGDEPRASRKREPAPPELFGVLLPGLPLSEDKVEAGLAYTCVGFWSHTLPGTGLAEKVKALSPQVKRCMVANMNAACVHVIEQMDAAESRKGVVTLFVRRNLEALRKSSTEFIRAECGTSLSATHQKLLSQLTAELYDTWLQPE